MRSTRVATTDGVGLLLRSWEPAVEPRAVIVIIHGLGEHSGRYRHVGQGLADRGFRALAIDLRGFGQSDGKRAFVEDFDEYLTDTGVAVEVALDGGLPVVLLGHSLGGLVALRYAQEREGPDLLVLSAPALDAAIPVVKRAAAHMLRRILPGFSLPNAITADQLSRDPAVGEAYFADPLVHIKTTAALGGAFLGAMAKARAGTVPVSTLVIHGEADTLVPPAFSEPLTDHAGVDRVTFPGFRHESFNEQGGVEAISAVADWIDRKLGQASP